jgi:hypothetical protein
VRPESWLAGWLGIRLADQIRTGASSDFVNDLIEL